MRRPKTQTLVFRRGITLIELLVVIAIMTMVAAIAIPRMRPMMENRNIRESARGVNVFLAQARVRAMESGLPCGVLFERDTDLNRPFACTVMRQVEIPPPYAGGLTGAAVIAQDWTLNPTSGAYHMPGYRVVKLAIRANGEWSDQLIRRGDTIQLDYQGPTYEIVDDLNDSPDKDFPVDANGYIQFSVATDSAGGDNWADNYVLTVRMPLGSAAALPWPKVSAASYPEVIVAGTVGANWSPAVPFKVYRQPSYDSAYGISGAFGSLAPTLQLPRGAVVDLGFSGVGAAAQFAPTSATDSRPVIVMFSPTGALAGVCYQDLQQPVTAPVFLLVGRADRADVNLLPDDGLNNWRDMNNFWLAISPQTGMVTAAEPAAGAADPDASRNLAREAQFSKGGR